MPEEALISIILPTFNGSRYLQDSIDSCLAQTWKNIELIIVDDGSTNPHTAAILDAQSDPRIRIVRQPENRGLPKALNAGFRESRGDMLTWTSDDNLYRPDALERMAEEIEKTNCDFVYAAASAIDEKGKIVGAMIPKPPDQLAIDNCVGGCFLYTRRVYETIGDYDPGMVLTEDYDYWIRVYRRFAMCCMDEDLYLYRYHPENLTALHGKRRIDEMVDKARHQHFSRGEILAAEGLRAFHRGDKAEARKKLAAAILRRPWNLHLYRPAIIVTLPRPLVGLSVKIKKAVLHK
ncbi:MAG: glycosyltransferase family 2 protein [Candidatus Sumerlaeia bacterium]